MENLNICLVIPEYSGNLGDTIIRFGIEVLLKDFFKKYNIITNFYHFVFENQPDCSDLKNKDFGLIVICGTPWIWDKCEVSKKYYNLTWFLNKHPESVKVALGIGSCFPLECDYTLVTQNNYTMKFLENLYKNFSLIIVRDFYALKVFKKLRKCSQQTFKDFCPSVLSFEYVKNLIPNNSINNKKKGCLIFYAPQFGLSKEVLNQKFIDKFVDFQYFLAKDLKLDIFCIHHDEYNFWKENFKDINITLFDNPIKIIPTLYKYKLVISGRIHLAIPSYVLGKKVRLLPVDTRYLTAIEIGIKNLWVYKKKSPYVYHNKILKIIYKVFQRTIQNPSLFLKRKDICCLAIKYLLHNYKIRIFGLFNKYILPNISQLIR